MSGRAEAEARGLGTFMQLRPELMETASHLVCTHRCHQTGPAEGEDVLEPTCVLFPMCPML